jgi:hypothetical protein
MRCVLFLLALVCGMAQGQFYKRTDLNYADIPVTTDCCEEWRLQYVIGVPDVHAGETFIVMSSGQIRNEAGKTVEIAVAPIASTILYEGNESGPLPSGNQAIWPAVIPGTGENVSQDRHYYAWSRSFTWQAGIAYAKLYFYVYARGRTNAAVAGDLIRGLAGYGQITVLRLP